MGHWDYIIRARWFEFLKHCWGYTGPRGGLWNNRVCRKLTSPSIRAPYCGIQHQPISFYPDFSFPGVIVRVKIVDVYCRTRNGGLQKSRPCNAYSMRRTNKEHRNSPLEFICRFTRGMPAVPMQVQTVSQFFWRCIADIESRVSWTCDLGNVTTTSLITE